MDSGRYDGDLTAGLLEIKGDFIQRSNKSGSYIYRNFDTSDSHKVFLSGVDQTVSFEDPGSGSSHIYAII